MISKEYKEYSSEAIDQINQLLTAENRNGTPIPFEVKVDGYIKIRKTDRIDRFKELYSFIDDNTETLIITLFTDPATEKREWYKFRLQNAPKEEALNGTDLEQKLNERLKNYDLEQEHKRTKEELQRVKAKLGEAEDYINTLTTRIEELIAKPNHIGKLDLTTLLTGAIEGIAINYPKVLSHVPVLNGITKVIQEEHKNKTKNTKEESFKGDVNFEIQPEDNQESNEEQQNIKRLYDFIASKFNEEERQLLSDVIVALGENPAQLKTVAELLNVDSTES